LARFMVVVSLVRDFSLFTFGRKGGFQALRLAARNVGVAIFALLTVAVAQSDPAAGIQPFSTQVGGPIDSVDLASSNILIKIPVRSKAGAMPFSFALISNSHAYKGPSGPGGTFQLVDFGFSGLPAGVSGSRLTHSGTTFQCQGNADNLYQDFAVVDATGGAHLLDPNLMTDGNYKCYALPQGAKTQDGSGYTVNFTTAIAGDIYDKSGKKVSGFVTSDPDSNTIAFSAGSYTDTLNTVAMTVVSQTGSWDKYEYQDSAGTTQIVQVNYSSYTQLTDLTDLLYQVEC
jgi:hypothetical protein